MNLFCLFIENIRKKKYSLDVSSPLSVITVFFWGVGGATCIIYVPDGV
jgi:hypothetical protein